MRVRQQDGYRAWSSPVWIERPERVTPSPDGGAGHAGPSGSQPDWLPGALLRRFYGAEAFGKPERLGFSGGVGSAPRWAQWWEPVGGGAVVRLRWWGGAEGDAPSAGRLRVAGAKTLRVRQVGFRCLKYGGDLFRVDKAPDGSEQVAWHTFWDAGPERKWPAAETDRTMDVPPEAKGLDVLCSLDAAAADRPPEVTIMSSYRPRSHPHEPGPNHGGGRYRALHERGYALLYHACPQ